MMMPMTINAIASPTARRLHVRAILADGICVGMVPSFASSAAMDPMEKSMQWDIFAADGSCHVRVLLTQPAFKTLGAELATKMPSY